MGKSARRIHRNRGHYPCSFLKACHALWGAGEGWSQTKVAIALELNQGTVSHVLRRHRWPEAYPIPLPAFEAQRASAA
jgi:hypothetical protein